MLFSSKQNSFFFKDRSFLRFALVFFTFKLFLSPFLACASKEQDLEIDICEPSLKGSCISSRQGAVIKSNRFLFQTNGIEYDLFEKKFTGEGDIFFYSCAGAFKGKRISYNFSKNAAKIEEGIFAYPPWVIEAPCIFVDSLNQVILEEPTITSDGSKLPVWKLKANKALVQDGVIYGFGITATFLDIPFLWLPKLTIDPEKLRKSPFKYHVRWGGEQGTRLGVTYTLYRTPEFEADVRADYRFKRGPGAGLETIYHSENQKHCFSTINYLANDNSIEDPDLKTRFRFQGLYSGLLPQYSTKVKLSYDKLSDKDMAADYYDESLGIEDAKRTELRVQTCKPWWRTNFLTKVQLNSFQSVKQELPTFEFISAPITLGKSGLLSLTEMRLSYLDYDYASSLDDKNFASSRYEITQKFSRLFLLDNLRVTPEVGMRTLYYGNSPSGTPKELVSFFSQVHAQYPLRRQDDLNIQTLCPYITHVYASEPTTPIGRHYVFDVHDGITNFNYTKFGLYSDLLFINEACTNEVLYADFYTIGFWDKHRLKEVFPQLFGELNSTIFPNFHCTIGGAWHYSKAHFDEWRGKVLWTASSDLAFAMEFRHRKNRFFRKVDRENYSLDQYHTLSELLSSSLADKRDTLLFHTYYRFHRNFALEYQSKMGWGRDTEGPYHEWQLDLHGKFASIWHCKLSYQLKEDDHRIAFYVNLLEPIKRCRAVFFQQDGP